MHEQRDPAIAVASSTHESNKNPSMASQNGSSPTQGHDIASPASEDFEFCVLSSGGLALAGGQNDAADMCAADEVFSGGKLLPLRLSSAGDASSPLLLPRSDSGAASTSGFSSRSSSRGSASSGSSSSCVSRSTSSESASSVDPASQPKKIDAAIKPARRSVSSSVFYAHPSPSPRPQPPRRSSAAAPPPAAWGGVIRLGVVGAPEVYTRRAPPARSGSQSARFEQASAVGTTREGVPLLPVDRKLGLGLLGAGLVCSCSPDAVVAPVGSAEAEAAEARRRRKKAEDKKRAAKQSRGEISSRSRRSRILDWLEELSMLKAKNVV